VGLAEGKSLSKVILSFLKIGTIGFGGGAALIPVIESEVVERKGWVDKEGFDVAVAAASISPASLPVSICAIWDQRYSLVSAYSYALPGPAIYMTLLTGFSMIGEAGVRYIRYASAGILAFVMLLIVRFVAKGFRRCAERGMHGRHMAAFAASFALYGGGSVRSFLTSILGLPPDALPQPVFALSMLDLIAILFFISCFVGASGSLRRLSAASAVSLAYALACGRMGALQKALPFLPGWASDNLTALLLALMALMAVASAVADRSAPRAGKGVKEGMGKADYRPIANIALFACVALAVTLLAFAVSGDGGSLTFAAKGLASSLTSFGGGEVYYAIADETFVQTGMIAREFYDARIMGFAGAMPGPVIVSIIAGVGFAFGSDMGGAAYGWLFGLVGIAMAVTATAFGALTLYALFGILKENPRLKLIMAYIIPTVCGVLASVAVNLMRTAAAVVSGVGLHALAGYAVMASILAAMLLVCRRVKVNDMAMFACGGILTLTGLSLASHLLP